MRYFEFASITEEADLGLLLVDLPPEPKRNDREDAVRRLKELNRERVRQLAIAVHKELARYLPQSELERLELERRLGW